MINIDKPSGGQAQADLTIGSGFKLIVGGIYHLLINPSNLLSGITNSSKPTTVLTNSETPYYDPLWVASVLVWQLPLPWLVNNSGITNNDKPA